MNLRAEFAKLTFDAMASDPRVWVLTGDLGFGVWDSVRDQYPRRFLNVGAAEQAMVDIGVGLALQGQIPIIYSITPFVLYRPFESLRNYLHHEQIPVKLVGSGRDRDYGHNGFSHWAEEDQHVLATLPNIATFRPSSERQLQTQFRKFVTSTKPAYLNLCR